MFVTPVIPEGDFAGYIFDCDGTLADTMPLHYRAWREALAEFSAEFPEALFYELGGMPARQIIQLLNERHGHSLPVDRTALKKETIFERLIPEVEPIEPVVRIARASSGKLPIAVASGGARRIVDQTLRGLGIIDLFDAVITNEDYLRGKPSPDPFLAAAKVLGVEPARCLVFEDTRTGEIAAHAAGMKCVLIPPRS
jgi:HAD superfamily hydrolase (TIGR01509 family)